MFFSSLYFHYYLVIIAPASCIQILRISIITIVIVIPSITITIILRITIITISIIQQSINMAVMMSERQALVFMCR